MCAQLAIAVELSAAGGKAAASDVSAVDKALGGLHAAGGKVTSGLAGLAGGLASIGKNAAGVALGVGLTQIPGMLLDFAAAAAEDERATARLDATLKTLPGSFDAMKSAVDGAITSGQALAFSDDEIRDSFTTLAQATGSSEEALKRQQVAMDLARGAGIPLEKASLLLGKVTEDNVEQFKRLGITIGEGASEADALAAVQAKFAGQAEAYAQSTAGQFEQAKLAMSEVTESIGAAVLPALAGIGKVLAANLPAIQDFVGKLSGGISTVIGPAIERLTDLFGPMLARLTDLGDVVDRVLAGDVGGAIRDFMGLVSETQLGLVEQMGGWARAMVEWIVPMVPDMLAALGEFTREMLGFVAENVSGLVEKLGAWAAAYIDWIGPQIPGLLRELGAFGASMFNWLVAQMPAIGEKLGQWGKAFIDWIGPRIGPMLLEAGKLLLELSDWIVKTAAPKLTTELNKWGEAFVMWVATDAIPALGGELDKLMNRLTAWVRDEGAPAAVRAAQGLGTSIIDGIRAGVSAKWESLKEWLGGLVRGLVPFAAGQIRAESPSKDFAEFVGAPMVDGIRVGWEAQFPALEAAVTRDLGGLAATAVDAYIAEIDRGAELSRNAWSNLASYAPGGSNAPATPGDGGGSGGSGGGSGGGSTGFDGKPMPGSSYLNDPLYKALQGNLGWHANVGGKYPWDFGPAEYEPGNDTVRGQGTAGTNVDKSGYYRVFYRLNSLLNARHETNVTSALLTAIGWVRDNTPADRRDELGWTIEGRASGGPVAAGRTYVVGERGPELLHMGGGGGHVTPNGAGGGVDYRRLGEEIARALSTVSLAVSVEDVHSGLLRKQRRNGAGSLGFR